MSNINKYPDDFSKRVAIRLLKIFTKSLKQFHDYKFNGTDPKELEFIFYIPIIKQDSNFTNGTQILSRLVSFTETYKSIVRIFSDNGRLCVQIKVKR